MRVRFLFLLAVILGIAVVPVTPVVGCVGAVPVACRSCCTSASHGCCATFLVPSPDAPLAPAPTSADEGSPLIAPTLAFLRLQPLPAAEMSAVHRLHPSRNPARALHALNCIRLI